VGPDDVLRFLRNPGRLYSRIGLSVRYGLRLRKPRLLLRLARSYAMAVAGMRPIRTVDFAPSYRCNMRCEHCFAAPLADPSRPELEPHEYRRIADEADALGAVHVAFQGGEPLAYPRLAEVIRAVDPGRFVVSVTTNAALLDAARVGDLASLGVDMLTISVDSAIPEEHDRFRSHPGAHAGVMRAIDAALGAGQSVCLNTCVTHATVRGPGFLGIVDLCRERGLKLTVVLPAFAGRWREQFDLMLSEDDRRFLDRLMAANPFIRRDLDANYLRWGCGAVKEMVYVSAYGDVFPCAYIHCSLGNLREEPLRDVLRRGLRVPAFAGYAPRCLAMEDLDFIRGRMNVTAGARRLPVPFAAMFPEHADAPPPARRGRS